MASKPHSAANSISSMKSLYMRCARFGSNSDECTSTHTDGCFSRKSSGSSVYGIRWNHRSFIGNLRPDSCARSSVEAVELHGAARHDLVPGLLRQALHALLDHLGGAGEEAV